VARVGRPTTPPNSSICPVQPAHRSHPDLQRREHPRASRNHAALNKLRHTRPGTRYRRRGLKILGVGIHFATPICFYALRTWGCDLLGADRSLIPRLTAGDVGPECPARRPSARRSRASRCAAALVRALLMRVHARCRSARANSSTSSRSKAEPSCAPAGAVPATGLSVLSFGRP
jgi:hypothetical protein